MKPFVVSIFLVLGTISAPIFSLSEDRFKELFEAKTPIKEIIAEVLPGDPISTYKHFQVLQDHIKKNDDYASYAQTLKTASQKILNGMLREMNYKGKVKIEKYIEAARNAASGLHVPDNMLKVIGQLNEYRRKLTLDAVEEAEKIITKRILNFIDDVDDQKNTQKETPAKEEPIRPKKNPVGGSKSKPRRSKSKTLAENSNA